MRRLVSTWAVLLAVCVGATAAQPPGVVVSHLPAARGIYVGSPSLAVLPAGDYVASHDEFGPNSSEHTAAVTRVFRSADLGRTWREVSVIRGAFWSTLFVHRGDLYLLGPDRHHGNVVIRRSKDGGQSWTTASSAASGLLRADGEYHCAPVPVVEHAGRLWRAMERRQPPEKWGVNYRAGVLSAPVDADLLNAAEWSASEWLPSDRSWNNGDMGAWLEGNVVVAPDGSLVNILRVETAGYPEKAAIVTIDAEGKRLRFDPGSGLVDFPGGAKKFTIRRDPKDGRFWTLATVVPERFRAHGRPARVRNTLALMSSSDLRQWTERRILLQHPDPARHGFQYVDWLIDGDDIIAACRTAHDDGQEGAHNNHDANFLTFHRWRDFRSLTPVDSAP